MAPCEPRTLTVALSGQLTREELPELQRRIVALVAELAAEILLCDVGRCRADAVSVEALGLLQLAGRRGGWRVSLLSPSPELLELTAFMGLADVLGDSEPER